MSADTSPYDALLLVSFGGPEGPDDVLPFLENVTRGRDIPRERLLDVGEHYLGFGGVSPINAQNRALVAALESDFAASGLDLPVYWGNRNWAPYLADTMAEMADAGVRRAVVLLTSAYSSYSGCRQYRENLAAAVDVVGERAPQLDRIRHYFNHPGFVEAMVANTLAALATLPADARPGAHLVFVTHSIPMSMKRPADRRVAPTRSSTATWPGWLLPVSPRRQVRTTRSPWSTAAAAARRTCRGWSPTSTTISKPWPRPAPHRPCWCRSASCPTTWRSATTSTRRHSQTAERLGLPCARAATVGTHPLFVSGLRELVLERAAAARGEQPVRRVLGALGPSHDVCPAGCCANPRGPRPACCGED